MKYKKVNIKNMGLTLPRHLSFPEVEKMTLNFQQSVGVLSNLPLHQMQVA